MAYHEPMSKQKILVVGGGFGGIKAALELGKGDNSKFDITLVSDQANFRYYPALYRTATGGVVAGSSIPLKTILSDKKVKIIQGTAETIDRKAHTLTLAGGEVLDYNSIILGLGVVTNTSAFLEWRIFRTVSSRLTPSSDSRNICTIRSRMNAGQT